MSSIDDFLRICYCVDCDTVVPFDAFIFPRHLRHRLLDYYVNPMLWESDRTTAEQHVLASGRRFVEREGQR